MGNLKVNSYLNQPLKAQIPLADLNGVAVSGIKASVASYDDYQRLGFTYHETLEALSFRVAKRSNGRVYIDISSQERIAEPYIELVIDLVWANGQLYRAYTVLLDPPNYTLTNKSRNIPIVRPNKKHQFVSGVVDRAVYQDIVVQSQLSSNTLPASKYGLTVKDETIWSIAQRYVRGGITLQQVALAVVGANPQAFKKGNLNGLLSGKQLDIPSTTKIASIPVSLANQEVSAHDRAWADKRLIEHVLAPPYINGIPAVPMALPETEISKTSRIPVLEAPVSTAKNSQNSAAPQVKSNAMDRPTEKKPVKSKDLFLYLQYPDTILPAIAGVAKPLSESKKPKAINATNNPATTLHPVSLQSGVNDASNVKFSNSVENQIKALKIQNQRLEILMEQREKALTELRDQINILVKERKALAGQSTKINLSNEGGFPWSFLFFLAFLIIFGIVGVLYLVYYSTEGFTKKINIRRNVFRFNDEKIDSEEPIQRDDDNSSVIITPKDRNNQTQDTLENYTKLEPSVSDPALYHNPTAAEITSILSNTKAEQIETGEKKKAASKSPGKQGDKNNDTPIKNRKMDASNNQESSPKNASTLAIKEPSISEDKISDWDHSMQDKTEKNNTIEYNPEAIMQVRSDSKIAAADKNMPKSTDNDFDGNLIEFSTKHQDIVETKKNEDTSEMQTDNKRVQKQIDANDNIDDEILAEISLEDIMDVEDSTVTLDETTPIPSPIDFSIKSNNIEEAGSDSEETSNNIAAEGGSHDSGNTSKEVQHDNQDTMVKSKAALNTLLELAQTYIGMDDNIAAREALEEVLKYGTDAQKETAQALLKQLADNT